MMEENSVNASVPLAVEERIFNELLPKLDQMDFFSSKVFDRTSLFVFAMALGFHQGKRTPLADRKGLIRYETLRNSAENSLFSAVALYELRKINQADHIADMGLTYKIANEYANTGFHFLADQVAQAFDEESFRLDRMEEMDDAFERIKGDIASRELDRK